MNITANNITEVLLGLIALAGEIPKDIKISEVSYRTLQNQISKAKQSRIFKIDNNHNRIRLRAPEGIIRLEEFSNELLLHYNMVTNSHKFQTSQKAVMGQKLFSQTVLTMIRNGYEIDNLSIVHESNHFGKNSEQKDDIGLVLGDGLLDFGTNKFATENNILPLIDAASLIPYDEKRFYTSKYLKHGESINDRINVSRITGIMLSEGNLYNVYTLEDGSRIFKSAELDMNNTIRNVYASAYGKVLTDFEAIIITNMLPSRVGRLEELFSHFYFLPPNIYGDFVIQILSRENWRAKLQEALYGEPAKDPRLDGVMNGTPSWELISCEYSKIQMVKKLAGSNPVNFIIFGWQEPILKQLTKGMNCTLQILTEEQEVIMFDYIKNA